MNLDKANRDRKLNATDKKSLMEVMSKSNHRLKSAAEAQADGERQTAQHAWEESIGAAEIREKIKVNCAETNELNTQLVERGCEPVDAQQRVNSAWEITRSDSKVKLSLKGNQLKEYQKHQAKMKEIDDAVGDHADDYYTVSAILYIETVGDAIDLLGETAPQLLGLKPVLSIENKEVTA
tara:strand:- start:1073 stop:1612 length:540 start_codon:yes stop_codon:yes gene_type:complete